jgi:hypothetical protein
MEALGPEGPKRWTIPNPTQLSQDEEIKIGTMRDLFGT